ncbi:MAG: leucine-rich repeat domain-containing protein [Clostridia bacterium]|nr:leucine-rich repeat domain-containing protein [Clostridia bacterium]
MSIKKTVALSLLSLLLCIGAVSCGGNNGNGTGTQQSTTAPTQAQTIAPRPQAPQSFDEQFDAAFALAAEAREEDLEYTVTNGEITVTKYKGSGVSVTIPERLNGTPITAIGQGAFADQTQLKALILPNGLHSLGAGILKGCTSLTALHTPFLGKTSTDTQYLGYLFGASTHNDHARDVVASLKLLSIGPGLTSIPDFALFDCNELIAIRLDQSIRSLGAYSLYRCRALQSINVDGIERIAEHAMDNCASLTHLTFGEGLSSIGIGALEGCASLEVLTLPFVGGSQTDNTYLAYLFGATSPDFSMGYYPPRLVEINLLSTCQSIGRYAFYEFRQLTYLSMEEGISSIGTRAFYGCESLRTLSIPNTVASIGDNAFFGCFRLEQLTLGAPDTSSLTAIGINAFYGCSSLTEIILPNALQRIPASCFADCTSLQRVELGGVRTVGKQAFRNCPVLGTILENPAIQYEE